MSIRQTEGVFVVDCDACPESLDDGDLVIDFDTPAEAEQAATDNGWYSPLPGRHHCPDEATA